MDTKARAEKIRDYAISHLIGDNKFVKFITSQLDQAVSYALKDREIVYEKDLKMRVDKAILEDRDNRCADDLYKRSFENGRLVGFAAAQEKAAGIAEEVEKPASDVFQAMEMTESRHLDEGKIGLQYILAMRGLISVSNVGDYGAKKYGQWNYKVGMPWMKLLGSCSRHLFQFILGMDNDSESGLPHMAHLAYNSLMLLDYMETHREKDDRFKESKKEIYGLRSDSSLPF